MGNPIYFLKMQLFLLVLTFSICSAQKNSDLDLLQQKTNSFHNEQSRIYKNDRPYNLSYNPLKFAGNSALWIYQRVFSEQVMVNCGFEPSCSSFATQAIKERGVILGVFLA